MLVAPVFAALRDEVLRALDADALITHNAHVDVGVLEHKLGGWECPEVFDTLKLARRLLPDQASYQLGALVDAVKLAEGLPEGLTPHGATYDAVVAARLFVRLATRPDSRPPVTGRTPRHTTPRGPQGTTMKLWKSASRAMNAKPAAWPTRPASLSTTSPPMTVRAQSARRRCASTATVFAQRQRWRGAADESTGPLPLVARSRPHSWRLIRPALMIE